MVSHRVIPPDSIDKEGAKARAEALANRPAVRAWMKRLRQLMKEQPPETWLFMQENVLHLMALNPERGRFMTDYGGNDQDSSIDSVAIDLADGGAW